MYVYLNNKGEFIEKIEEDPLKTGETSNDIYIYWEDLDTDTLSDSGAILHLTKTGLTADSTELSNLLSTEDLVLSTREDIVTSEIPYEEDRTYKSFKNFAEYKFIHFELESTNLDVAGLMIMTVELIYSDTENDLSETFTTYVEDSKITIDSDITSSQYLELKYYILRQLGNKISYANLVEVDTYDDLPETGDVNKTYVTLDTNKNYQWSGTQYVPIYLTTRTEGELNSYIETYVDDYSMSESEIETYIDTTSEAYIDEKISEYNPETFNSATETEIIALTENGGIYVASDTGYIWVWSDTNSIYEQGALLYDPKQVAMLNSANTFTKSITISNENLFDFSKVGTSGTTEGVDVERINNTIKLTPNIAGADFYAYYAFFKIDASPKGTYTFSAKCDVGLWGIEIEADYGTVLSRTAQGTGLRSFTFTVAYNHSTLHFHLFAQGDGLGGTQTFSNFIINSGGEVNRATYSKNGISYFNGTNTYTQTYPEKSGTFAMTSDTDALDTRVTQNEGDVEEVPISSFGPLTKVLNIYERPTTIKFIGDSITAGFGGTDYTLEDDTFTDGSAYVTTDGYCFANEIIKNINNHYGTRLINLLATDDHITCGGSYDDVLPTNYAYSRKFYANSTMSFNCYSNVCSINLYAFTTDKSFSISVNGGTAQTVIYNSTVVKKIDVDLSSYLIADQTNSIVITFLEDLIAEDETLVNYVTIQQTVNISNKGVFGKSFATMYPGSEIFNASIDGTEDLLILMLGTNDRNVDFGTLRARASFFVQSCFDLGVENIVLMCSCPYAKDDESTTYNLTMRDVHEALKEVAQSFNLMFIDNYNAFIDYSLFHNVDISTLYLTDGIHPNDYGYKIIYYNICNALNLPCENSDSDDVGDTYFGKNYTDLTSEVQEISDNYIECDFGNLLSNYNFEEWYGTIPNWNIVRTTIVTSDEIATIASTEASGEHYIDQTISAIEANHTYYVCAVTTEINTVVKIYIYNRNSEGNYINKAITFSDIGNNSFFVNFDSIYTTPASIVRITIANSSGTNVYLGAGEYVKLSTIKLVDVTDYVNVGMSETEIKTMIDNKDTLIENLYKMIGALNARIAALEA